MDATDAFEHHETDPAALAGLPEAVLERARVAAQDKNLDGWLLKLDPPTFQSVMTHAENADLRQLYYRAWVTRASEPGSRDWDNNPVIEDILRLRQRAAELLGFDNYAALSLARKMAQSESQVLEFLEDLAARSRGYAEKEFRRLEEFAGRALETWDIAFYAEKLKQQTFSIGDEELRAYFPVPKVLEGLFALVEKLFAIRIRQVDGLRFWHETVRKFEITNLDGTPVGALLMDLYTRPNKRGGAWMDSAANRARLESLERDPIAHLVCNFAPPSATDPSYITHNDVVTLFHEFACSTG
jgi:oligopeptidase A